MTTDLSWRAAAHAALGDEHRLRIVDELRLSDRTPTELGRLAGLGSNLLAFHLTVLEDAGLIARQRSQGDGRRRYVTLLDDALAALATGRSLSGGPVLFVCTRNAARSQMAAAMWRARTSGEAASAGARPAERVDALAREVAAAHGIDLGDARPRGYADVEREPAVVVSVCDRAYEAALPWTVPLLHWSVPDPAGGTPDDYERAYVDLDRRVTRLAAVTGTCAA